MASFRDTLVGTHQNSRRAIWHVKAEGTFMLFLPHLMLCTSYLSTWLRCLWIGTQSGGGLPRIYKEARRLDPSASTHQSHEHMASKTQAQQPMLNSSRPHFYILSRNPAQSRWLDILSEARE